MLIVLVQQLKSDFVVADTRFLQFSASSQVVLEKVTNNNVIIKKSKYTFCYKYTRLIDSDRPSHVLYVTDSLIQVSTCYLHNIPQHQHCEEEYHINHTCSQYPMMSTQGRCSLGDQCKAPDGHLRPKYKCQRHHRQ